MNSWIDLLIVVLLPVTALFTVLQKRPYHALVLRGIMGAVAVLLYAVLGAPDVALTEALVGTLLTVVLYAIAVRSSMGLRVGRLDSDPVDCPALNRFCEHHDLVLRQNVFESRKSQTEALLAGRIDAVQVPAEDLRAGILPAGEMHASDACVIVLAPHCRWHEAEMKKLFEDSDPVIRVDKRFLKGGGACAGFMSA